MKMNKETAQHYAWGEICEGWRLADRQNLSVIQERMPPHTSEKRHIHQAARQFFFILAGQAKMELDGETVSLSAWEGVEVPPGVPHTMQNPFDEEAEFLVISSPSTAGDRVPADNA
ncbi:MAG TPA: cupin domain-containing protein [Candidatus Cryosericum sp.]|nr:cupin domain-containing protein [Candidatus Cryosericum sp.]